MVVCDHCACSFNADRQCGAPDELVLDARGRCIHALRLAQDTLERILDFLERFTPYPFDEEKDREFFSELIDDFPDHLVLAELKAFHAWILDLAEPPEKGYRSMLRKWIHRAHQKSDPKEHQGERQRQPQRVE